MIRRRIVFRGWVQGVGFRWRARHAAQRFGCTGWVRNESDGTVTMEIQGRDAWIQAVILAVKAGKYVSVERMDVQTIPVDEEERSFR